MQDRITIDFDFHVGTVHFWRTAAPHFGVRKWYSAQDRFALRHGRATAILANDGARVVTRLPDGKLSRRTYPPEKVHWRGLLHDMGPTR